jgi:hypothetical protein
MHALYMVSWRVILTSYSLLCATYPAAGRKPLHVKTDPYDMVVRNTTPKILCNC